jgi:catechol 2,3-dioxygenase-like lactoylglutathione lyase family enzyme
VTVDSSAAILKRQEQFWSALRRKDARLMMQVLADDFVYRAESGEMLDRGALIATLTGMPAEVGAITSEHIAVDVLGDVAIVTGVQIGEVVFADGTSVTERLALNNTFQLRDGAWQMVLAHPVTLPPQDRGSRLRSSVPALVVSDVDATAAWYAANLGFLTVGIFPSQPPAVWASLQRDHAEIMLQHLVEHRKPEFNPQRSGGGWHVYIRAAGLHRLYEEVRDRPFVKTPLRRQPYGDWEFEVEDLNGYVLVFGGDETLSEPADPSR